jgi:hypothetical protein
MKRYSSFRTRIFRDPAVFNSYFEANKAYVTDIKVYPPALGSNSLGHIKVKVSKRKSIFTYDRRNPTTIQI